MQSVPKPQWRVIFDLAWPTMAEQALGTVVQYIDTGMVGRLGAHATACIGLTSSATWMVNSPLWAFGVGVLACTAKAVGAKDEQTVRRTASQTVLLTLVLGVIIGVLTLVISPFLPAWLGAEESLRRDGGLYFGIVCSPMLFRAALTLFAASLRATGDTRTPMFINVGINVLNIILNALLIYGCGWGVVGAAIATAVSYAVGGIVMSACFFRNKRLSLRGTRIRYDREAMAPIIRISVPVVGTRLATFLGHVVFSSLVTSLGTQALASHTLALTAEQAFYIPGYGMQAAGATLAGQALGERDRDKLWRVSRTVMTFTILMMCLTGGILFLIPRQMMALFTADAAVIAGGVPLLRIIAVTEPVYGMGIILEGVFEGVGETRAPFVYSLVCMWGIRILGTVLCVRYFGLGLVSVWLCMAADNSCRGFMLAVKYFRRNWLDRLLPPGRAAD
ncbi:MAG: MATE family efflux transporter [Clostridia bacterium]|nr:MATE family efflux transporter [Clostridia bacterium]